MTRSERLAAVLRASPGRWIDGRELAEAGGCYAWRTRISELRRPPFNMEVQNRQRASSGPSRFIVSEYRFVPHDAAPQRQVRSDGQVTVGPHRAAGQRRRAKGSSVTGLKKNPVKKARRSATPMLPFEFCDVS